MANWIKWNGQYSWLDITATETNVDNANNKSDVTVTIYEKSDTTAYNNYDNSLLVKINNTQVADITFRYDFRDGSRVKLLGSWKLTVTHNPDGSYACPIYVYADMIDDPDALLNTTIALTKIPRASTFTASDITVDDTSIPLTLAKSPIATGHKATLKVGTNIIFENLDIGADPASVPLTPENWNLVYGFTRDTASPDLTLTIDTYQGTSKVAGYSDTFKATYPTSIIPTLSGITATEKNTNVSNVLSGVFLKTLSSILLAINGATGVKGSTIKEYEINIYKAGVKTGSSNTQSYTYTPTDYGSFTASARVKDSRGRWSSSTSVSFTILDYRKPILELYDIVRADSSGAELSDGTYAKNFVKGNVSSVIVNSAEKNLIRISIDRITAPAGQVLAPQTVLNTSIDSSYTIGTYDPGSAFEFRLVLTDAFGESTALIDQLPVATFAGFLGKKGMAFTGIYDENDTKGVSVQAYDTVHIHKDLTIEQGFKKGDFEIPIITEQGGDLNNGYKKYSDGTMEQWKMVSFASQAINTALGSYEFWSGIKSLGNWAVAFYSIAETASFELATSDVGITVNLNGSTTTSAGNVYLITRRTLTPNKLNITIKARGRWKA